MGRGVARSDPDALPEDGPEPMEEGAVRSKLSCEMGVDPHTAVTQILAEAGCLAASEEAGELIRAAGGDPEALKALVARRVTGEPIAWLTGQVTFCDLVLFVARGIYVPRWQTEPLALGAASLLPQGGVAVDLCTGAGPIAAVLAAAVPSARVLATEIDGEA